MTAEPIAPIAQNAPARPMRKDAARNRELLIEAARDVFAKRGLEASLDDIARQAGVGVGTAYRHFANKYELAAAIMEQTVDAIVLSAEEALLAEDPWLGLVGFLEAATAAQAVDRGLREALAGLHDPEKVARVVERLTLPVEELVRRAQRSGAIRDDFEFTDLGFIMGMLGFVAEMVGDAAPELWRRYLTLLLNGLRPGGDPMTTPALSEPDFRAAMLEHKARTSGQAGRPGPGC